MLRLVIMLVATTWVAIVAPARAYDIAAHATITRRALPQSRLAEILKSLGFEKGLSHEFFNRGLPESVVEAIAQGAMSEDEPDTRVVNHFHNPLVPIGLSPSLKWPQHPAVLAARTRLRGSGTVRGQRRALAGRAGRRASRGTETCAG